MKFLFPASSILCPLLFLFLAGCESFGMPDIWAHDQVPPDIKAQPVLVNVTPPPGPSDPKVWPRLGDVPFKPKDFSPPLVYDHYMDELEFQRSESEADKERVEDEAPVMSDPDTSVAPLAPQTPSVLPPQFPKE